MAVGGVGGLGFIASRAGSYREAGVCRSLPASDGCLIASRAGSYREAALCRSLPASDGRASSSHQNLRMNVNVELSFDGSKDG